MGWATQYINDLAEGKTVSFRPKGTSMVPLINSGDKVTVAPIEKDLEKGDIVLCKVNGRQIANNRGFINGWTKTIYGIVILVEK